MAERFCLKPFVSHLAALIALAVMLIPGLPALADTAEKEIAVIGSSRIYDNVTSARNAAVAEGLLSAVESVALERIPEQTLKTDFDLISAKLYEKRLDFTQGYQVLKEVNTGEYYRLLIRTTVSVAKIQNMLQDLGIAMAPEALPKALFLVAEKHADDLSFYYGWQTQGSSFAQNAAVKSIKQVFREKGFPVIDQRDLAFDEIFADLELSAEITKAEAIMLGRRTQADVVIFGKARASETSNKMGGDIKTFKGTVSVTAVDVENEAVIQTIEQTETAADPNVSEGSRHALSNAGYRTGKILSEKISAAWQQQTQQKDRLEVHVKGEGDILPQLVSFRKALRDMEGVKALQTKERSRSEAVLSLNYEGSARSLADRILLTTFDGFGVNIYELTENRLRIDLLTDPAVGDQ
ncbi:MAG TPA: hypothetical protein VKN73_06455 [Desulfosalsimonadaceae bacterium]|nr:hypothetical protein [Desulfosalsimonadaceae bacterium]